MGIILAALLAFGAYYIALMLDKQNLQTARYLSHVAVQSRNTVAKQVEGDFQTLEALAVVIGRQPETDVETLLAQLGAVRRGELAMEREESTDQLACWALPLRRKGTVFAALSISVPLFRCREEKIELVRRSLRAAQAEIEKLAETQNFGLSEN